MKIKDIKIIVKETDKIVKKFDKEEFTCQDYLNYSKILKHSYFKNIGLHRKSRECVIIGCTEKSIKKSHSIPKSSVFQNIASKGHLLKPEFDISNDFPINKMTEIGLNNASVFPGFCEKHENIFKSFEIDGKIDDEKKALLQTYRTICRERVYREIEIEINETTRSEYLKKINEEAKNNIAESLSRHHLFDKITDFEIQGIDSTIYSINKINQYLNSPISKFNEFEKYIQEWLLNSHKKTELIISIVNLNIALPVSICGFGNQSYRDNGEDKNAFVLLNVMPQKTSTDIIYVGLEQDKKITNNYFEYSLSNPISILNTIESFMVNGTDHWYINPDYWNTIPETKQEKILFDILYTDDSFLDEYPISIFDDIRMDLISIFKENAKNRKTTVIEDNRIKCEIDKVKHTNYEIIKDKDVLAEKILTIQAD